MQIRMALNGHNLSTSRITKRNRKGESYEVEDKYCGDRNDGT